MTCESNVIALRHTSMRCRGNVVAKGWLYQESDVWRCSKYRTKVKSQKEPWNKNSDWRFHYGKVLQIISHMVWLGTLISPHLYRVEGLLPIKLKVFQSSFQQNKLLVNRNSEQKVACVLPRTYAISECICDMDPIQDWMDKEMYGMDSTTSTWKWR